MILFYKVLKNLPINWAHIKGKDSCQTKGGEFEKKLKKTIDFSVCVSVICELLKAQLIFKLKKRFLWTNQNVWYMPK